MTDFIALAEIVLLHLFKRNVNNAIASLLASNVLHTKISNFIYMNNFYNEKPIKIAKKMFQQK